MRALWLMERIGSVKSLVGCLANAVDSGRSLGHKLSTFGRICIVGKRHWSHPRFRECRCDRIKYDNANSSGDPMADAFLLQMISELE